MTAPRRFTRFRNQSGPGYVSLPEDGMCLSAYLILRAPAKPREVLLGRIDPAGPWAEVAALDATRVSGIGDRWVLPATQLLMFESPAEAAARIARELLGRQDLALGSPAIYSEAYGRSGGPADPHWDLQFVFTADWPGGSPDASRGKLWKELRFVDVGTAPLAAFGRGHGDVLALAGYPPRSSPSA
jgi:hypothetical protein